MREGRPGLALWIGRHRCAESPGGRPACPLHPQGQGPIQAYRALCRAGGEDIGEWMVRRGWALAYRRYSRDYAGQEEAAEAEDAGIWGSAFMAPWRWRKMMRDAN